MFAQNPDIIAKISSEVQPVIPLQTFQYIFRSILTWRIQPDFFLRNFQGIHWNILSEIGISAGNCWIDFSAIIGGNFSKNPGGITKQNPEVITDGEIHDAQEATVYVYEASITVYLQLELI